MKQFYAKNIDYKKYKQKNVKFDSLQGCILSI